MKKSTLLIGVIMGIPPWGFMMSSITTWLGLIGLIFQFIGLGILVTYAISKQLEYNRIMKRIKEESDKWVAHNGKLVRITDIKEEK